jgi:hypothetical protein
VVRSGKNGDEIEAGLDSAGKRVDLADAFDLVAKKLDAVGEIFFIGGHDFENVAAGAEGGADEFKIAPFVMHLDEVKQNIVAADFLLELKLELHLAVVLGGAQAIDA